MLNKSKIQSRYIGTKSKIFKRFYFLLLIALVSPLNSGTTSQTETNLVTRVISGMTFEQKIGQLILLFPKEGSVPYRDIEKYSIGGVFINERHVGFKKEIAPLPGEFASNLPSRVKHARLDLESHSTEEIVGLLHRSVRVLQQNATMVKIDGAEYRIPLFMASDFEGGDFPALAWGITGLPGMMSLAQTGRCDCALDAGRITGREMRALGFNMNLAPVADIIVPGKIDIFGRRSAGEDPALVSNIAVSFASGLHDGYVLSIAKHFPGHGKTVANPHWELPIDDSPLPDLERQLAPFLALRGKVDGFMAAHVHFNQLQPGSGTLPISLDGRFLPPLVKKHKLDDSLWITDELFKMKAVWKGLGVNPGNISADLYYKAVYRALEAGHDILLFRDQDQLPVVIRAMRDFFGKNPAKLNNSLRKVLAAKFKIYPDFKFSLPSDNEAVQVIRSNAGKASQIVRESIVLIKDDEGFFANNGKPLDPAEAKNLKIMVVAPSNGIYSRNLVDVLREKGYFVNPYYLPFKEKQWTETRVNAELDDNKAGNIFNLIKTELKSHDERKTFILLAFSRPNEAVFVAGLLNKTQAVYSGKKTPPTIFIALGEPYLLPMEDLRGKRFTFIAASSRIPCSMEAILDVLEGKFKPKPLNYLTVSIKGLFTPLQNPKPCPQADPEGGGEMRKF